MIELSPAPGQNFMCVRLVADIPDNLVFREIEGNVKRHGQFDRSEITGEVTACDADFFDQKLPDFFCKTSVLVRRDFLYIVRVIYFFNKCQRLNPPLVVCLFCSESSRDQKSTKKVLDISYTIIRFK